MSVSILFLKVSLNLNFATIIRLRGVLNRISVKGTKSLESAVIMGVPRRSVLGPFGFNLYLTYLASGKILKIINFLHDDGSLLFKDNDYVNDAILTLVDWVIVNPKTLVGRVGLFNEKKQIV